MIGRCSSEDMANLVPSGRDLSLVVESWKENEGGVGDGGFF